MAFGSNFNTPAWVQDPRVTARKQAEARNRAAAVAGKKRRAAIRRIKAPTSWANGLQQGNFGKGGRAAQMAALQAAYDKQNPAKKKPANRAKNVKWPAAWGGSGGTPAATARRTAGKDVDPGFEVGQSPKGASAPNRQPTNRYGNGAKVPPRKSSKRSSAPSLNGRKKSNSRPPDLSDYKAKMLTAKQDKERYKKLQANRANQSEKNYEKKAAGKKYKAGQKIYNDQTKAINRSRYSWKSHKAAMARRGKKATQASYAKFKRYNGV